MIKEDKGCRRIAATDDSANVEISVIMYYFKLLYGGFIKGFQNPQNYFFDVKFGIK